MTLVDKKFLTYQGTPVALRRPAKLYVDSKVPLPANAMGEANQQYQIFCNSMEVSLLQQAEWRGWLPSGVWMEIRAVQKDHRAILKYRAGWETKCFIEIDNGVVDLIGIWPSEHQSDPGKIYRTKYVQDYFNAPPTRGIIGKLPVPQLSGKFPDDGALSYGFPEGRAGKKLTAARVPASIFTGRTRLWVQSLYGANPRLMQWVGSEDTYPPSLRINGILVSTSCGVHLDLRGRHWLVCVRAATTVAGVTWGNVEVYQMLSSACGEELRKKLVDPKIRPEERQRIEAYVLSSSLPIPKTKQMLSATFSNNQWPMEAAGYGWHFNFTGNKCDIVTVRTILLPEFAAVHGGENESVHYRLEFSANEYASSLWSMSASIVETARWKSSVDRNVIASPLWMLGVLYKMGIRYGASIPYGDAPYYVFYSGDDIQVCRYSATYTTVQPVRNSRPSYYGGHTPGRTPSNTTVGSEGGMWQDTLKSEHIALSLKIGSVGYSADYDHTSGNTDMLSEKTNFQLVAYNTTFESAGWHDAGTHTVDRDQLVLTPHGDCAVSAPVTWISNTVSRFCPAGHFRYWAGVTCDYTWSVYAWARTIYSRSVVVIPFYDSEAIYCYTETFDRDYKKGSKSWYSGDYSGAGVWWRVDDSEEFDFFSETWSRAGSPQAIHAIPDRTETLEEDTTAPSYSAYMHYGTSSDGLQKASFKMKSTGQFFDPMTDIIEQQFYTISSVNGTVYGDWAEVKNNFGPTDPDSMGPIAFVGWA